MDLYIDVESKDLEADHGDFVLANRPDQDAELIVGSVAGEFKNAPLMGVAIQSYLNAPGNVSGWLVRAIKQQFKRDKLQADVSTRNDEVVIENVKR